MSRRVASIIVVAEDTEQSNLIRRYLERAGHHLAKNLRVLHANKGCGSQWVRTEFSRQVAACRGRIGKGASCLLLVMTDADNLSCEERQKTLLDELKKFGQASIADHEPIVIFTPKWQVETWIKCLLGQQMDEDDKTSDQPPVDARQIRLAAGTLYDWARPNAAIGGTCVPSLKSAMPRWRSLDPA